ncbi:BlaI/MecI/CopY family transcriptional regulator [Gulosibacter sp. 10]|uniref:BlaI/MecI/CopY family transcriptional regulator n=1 Tax=Gulosibacter sp. 10 TaxID=1255570 RepID=UPI00097F4CE7|nr:BlaI/MecI/CopY family transcriptional regulator [Gulosibacter sp. 10]SJM70516.1 Transcriptional regulator, MecI family [Gulosibacter sp. 10]
MGELERKIMDLLWDADGSLSAQEIREALVDGDASKPDTYPAITTILTVLKRLQRKDLLIRLGSKRPYRYSPSRPRAEHMASLMHEVLQASSEREAVLAMFVSNVGSSDTETLRRLLREQAG